MSLNKSTVEETVRAIGMTESGKVPEGEDTYRAGRMHGANRASARQVVLLRLRQA